MNTQTKIPGACMCHKIISDQCRENRGDLPAALSAIADAERSLREGMVNLGHAKGFKFHVVVTCERPGVVEDRGPFGIGEQPCPSCGATGPCECL